MNAEHAAQLRLLELQAADTALAQLAHRRKTLPELSEIAARDERGSALQDELVEAETALADVDLEQRRLENEVDTVRSRSTRDDQRLRAGGLPAKELESLQHEIATLSRRQSTLEDELLEVMEKREELAGAVGDLTGQRDQLDRERAELVAARDTAFADIDASSQERSTERDKIAAELPADLLALYERAREHGGGVGAAMLRQRRCEGCHIELSGTELSAVRAAAPDEVVRCDNCRRILVRTAESGL
ncbi:MAG TPA: C4-type zinc ribbon domain-containing protein [Jatrophihabitantaceae bacterium]|nr:C4-type zinc ribbon domain-containing protein [Jatrophihabitantaceae bacterium]